MSNQTQVAGKYKSKPQMLFGVHDDVSMVGSMLSLSFLFHCITSMLRVDQFDDDLISQLFCCWLHDKECLRRSSV